MAVEAISLVGSFITTNNSQTREQAVFVLPTACIHREGKTSREQRMSGHQPPERKKKKKKPSLSWPRSSRSMSLERTDKRLPTCPQRHTSGAAPLPSSFLASLLTWPPAAHGGACPNHLAMDGCHDARPARLIKSARAMLGARHWYKKIRSSSDALL
jgi:hypothetical protein